MTHSGREPWDANDPYPEQESAMAVAIHGPSDAELERATAEASRRITWNLEVSPLTIQIMLACFCTPEPSAWFEAEQWTSRAAIDARAWLCTNGLITQAEEPRATDKGKAWVGFICATPLPVPQWVLPPREETKP